MKIAICDDNIDSINIIENYIQNLNTRNVECDAFESGEDLIFAYDNNERYDVVFLDMEMKELNGIETANIIRNLDRYVIIIFVTSHTKYMLKSFECEPFRFLVKPITEQSFIKVYKELCIKLKDRPETVVFLENRNRTRIFCDDIIFFESYSHWIIIHTKDNQSHKIRKTMSEIINTFDNLTFIQVHRSFVVNINYILKIYDSSVIMHYYDVPIPVSRTFKKDLDNKFINHKERKYLL